jgi:hypothetical protein
MATQNWLSPNPLAGDPIPPPPPHAGAYDLRPLSVGEVLDRVFSLYRTHFWFFAGLSAASASVNTGIGILRLVFMHFAHFTPRSMTSVLILGGLTFLQLGLFLVAYSFTLAATTFAVNAFYLGQPTSLGVALTVARQLWLRCLGIAIWQGWSATWAFMLLVLPIVLIPGARGNAAGIAIGLFVFVGFIAGMVYGIVAYLRNALALPAAVVENLRVRAAMRRSKNLATGRIGRIFLLFLLVYALWVIVAVIQMPLVFLAARTHAAEQFVMQGVILAVNFIVTTVVGPIAAIGLCLFYFDERVRREGFDIEMLLRGASASPALPVAESTFAADPTNDLNPAPEQI